MHKRFVINIVSRVWLIVCFFMLAPLGWALHDNFHSAETVAFIVTILLGVAVSSLSLFAFPVKRHDFPRVNAKDGLAIVGLSWILLSLFGALPLYLSGTASCYTDGFFEIVSGFTTTGASIFSDVESLPRGILFWRSLTHWLGGMGIIVLYLALLPALGQTTFQLYKAEMSGVTNERLTPRIKETAKTLWGIYLLLSFLEALLHLIGGMSVFDALCQTFGAIATGGFSTKNASLAAFSAYHQWVVIVFMFLGGTNFILHFQALRGKAGAFIKNEEFRWYLGMVIALSLLFALGLKDVYHEGFPIRNATFQVVSIVTATGYSTANFDAWPNILRMGLLLLMLIGGCAGSTAGGFKIARAILVGKVAKQSVVGVIFPNAVLPLKIDGRPLSRQVEREVLSYFVIFMLLFFGGAGLLTLLESCDLVTSLSATISLLSNVGPGLAKVGPLQNYAWISVPGKWLLSFIMLAGRLELYALLVLFVPATWRK